MITLWTTHSNVWDKVHNPEHTSIDLLMLRMLKRPKNSYPRFVGNDDKGNGGNRIYWTLPVGILHNPRMWSGLIMIVNTNNEEKCIIDTLPKTTIQKVLQGHGYVTFVLTRSRSVCTCGSLIAQIIYSYSPKRISELRCSHLLRLLRLLKWRLEELGVTKTNHNFRNKNLT